MWLGHLVDGLCEYLCMRGFPPPLLLNAYLKQMPNHTTAFKILRTLDANLNRAMEGLRVCEELVRFCGGRRSDFLRLRDIRHNLGRYITHLPLSISARLKARDTRMDPGRRLSAVDMGVKPSKLTQRVINHALLVNFQRAKEAFRVIEECSRLICPSRTAGFQAMRFQTYDAERKVILSLAAIRNN